MEDRQAKIFLNCCCRLGTNDSGCLLISYGHFAVGGHLMCTMNVDQLPLASV